MKLTRYFSIILGIILLLCSTACKTVKLADAEEKQRIGEYYDAAAMYRKLYTKAKPEERDLRAYIAYRMGECNRLINSTARSLSAYMNALRYEYPDSILHLKLGQMAQKSAKYSDAIKHYNNYLEYNPNSILSKNGIEGSQQAAIWKKNPTRYVVKKMDKFNSRRSEFSPMLYGEEYDQLYFASSREPKNVVKKNTVQEESNDQQNSSAPEEAEPSGITGVLNNDFFLVKQDDKGNWLSPIELEDAVNTQFDEGTPSFTSDGNTMYYTYCSSDEASSRTAEIYVSKRSSAAWGKGSRAAIVKDSVTALAHPAISPDGNWLYFTTDAIGGHGGKDIYRCRVSGSEYGPMENLGSQINTPADEVFPYVRDSATIYFASNGHPGMGGLDLFKATQDINGQWTVENLKAPINSNSDDFGITFEGNKERGFFSSNRNDGRGSDHIYSFELPTVTVNIEGYVSDAEEYPIENATVRIVGKDGLNVKTTTNKEGEYSVELERDIRYVMMASARGFLNQNFELKTGAEEKNETYIVDFYLSPIYEPVVIENIFYDFDKATLRPESEEALNELVKTLNDNPHVTIELGAHTDRKGTEEYNERLAQRRAQSVIDYIITQGISQDRLEAKGYGEKTPKTINKKMAEKYPFLVEDTVLTEEYILTLPIEQQEQADQINRRTEFKVLRTNYNLY